MGKLCERPGCSEIAALAYGMRTEDLIFWIDVLGGDSTAETGVLCQRHADSMTVPRGWTLDDLRDPDLHLFRPPERPDGPATRRNRTRRRASDETGQLSLGDLGDADHLDDPGALEHDGSDDTTEAPPVEAPPTGVRPTDDLGQDPADQDAADQDAADQDPADQDAADQDPADQALAGRSGALDWKPAYDDGDDLDGQLAARSPLLSRAFRGERS